MQDILWRGWENFVERTTGPLNMRFVIQPAVAAFLAIKAGLRDARERRPAYLAAFMNDRAARRALAREGFKDVSKVMSLAAALDMIYQLLVERGIYVMELLFTVTTLALAPYLLLRGPTRRLATWGREAARHAHLRRPRAAP